MPATAAQTSPAANSKHFWRAELNRIIQGPSLYDPLHPERFAGFLSLETESLLALDPAGPALERLNRMLLEDAYPEIARDRSGIVHFTVERAAALTEVALVYDVIGGTANPGTDYVLPRRGLLVFAPGEVTKSFTLLILPDATCEGRETVVVKLKYLNGCDVPGKRGQTVLNILEPRKCSDDDVLEGGGQDDMLVGDYGYISGLEFSDVTLLGGNGNDIYRFDADNALGTDKVVEDVNEGVDTLDFGPTGSQPLTVDLASVLQQKITDNSDNLHLFLYGGNVLDNVIGSQQPDVLGGNALDNTLTGNLGDDELYGEAGTDRVRETRDSAFQLFDDYLKIGRSEPFELDWLFSIEQAELIGGPSANQFTVSGWTQEAWLHGRCSQDTVIAARDANFELTDSLLTLSRAGVPEGRFHLDEIEQAELTGAAGENSIDASSFTGSTILTGGDLDDDLTGGLGPDLIFGGPGEDTIDGGQGNDTIYGSEQADIIHGGDHDDTIDGGSGEDTIYGDAGNDEIYGREDNDTIDAGDGDDTVYGGPANDEIHGGPGADLAVWNEGDGNDTIDGGSGNDTVEVITGSTDDQFVAGTSAVDATRTQFERLSAPAFLLDLGAIEVLEINADDGQDTLTVNTLPVAGGVTMPGTIVFEAGSGSNDAVIVHGSASAEVYELGNGAAPMLTLRQISPAVLSLNLGGIESLTINAAGADDRLTVNDLAGVNPLPTLAFHGDAGANDAVTVNGSAGADLYALNNHSLLFFNCSRPARRP